MANDKLAMLIKKGRVVPILQRDGMGRILLMGYRRKAGSRKSYQEFSLKVPKVISEVKKDMPVFPPELPGIINLPVTQT